MWPWIKRWRDWAMNNLLPISRFGPQPQVVHYSFEKAGLSLYNQPIPWNAEVVRVEALVRLPVSAPRNKADFTIQTPNSPPQQAETMRPHSSAREVRVTFRLPTPTRSVIAEMHWREARLGQLTLPILTYDEFIRGLRLQMPTVFVRIGEQNVACQTFVSTQCRGISASAVLTSPTALAPLHDLDMRVEFQSERGFTVLTVPVRLSSSQLSERQALITVTPQGFPRRMGAWLVRWLVGDHELATQRLKAVSQLQFQRSLRIADTRFVIQDVKGQLRLAPLLPTLDDVERIGPGFLVASRELGMAGACSLQVRVPSQGGGEPLLLPAQEVLITDGPTLVVPGTLHVADLRSVSAFELLLRGTSLGMLPLSPIPAAAFTSEGGFKPATEFTWSIAADEELHDRLTRLLEEKGTIGEPG